MKKDTTIQMKRKIFLERVEKFRPIAIGNYREICQLEGIDLQDFTYAMSGRKSNEEFLSKCYNAITNFCNKVIEKAA